MDALTGHGFNLGRHIRINFKAVSLYGIGPAKSISLQWHIERKFTVIKNT